MRTVDQVLQRIKERQPDDFFGFEIGDYVNHLSFEAAKPWLQPQVIADDWTQLPLDRDAIIAEMLDYMPFAWDKANNCRGLSAMRSLNHFTAWMWLVDDDEAVQKIAQAEDNSYGKPTLRMICEHYGWDWKQWDDGCWRNSEMDDCNPVPEQVEVHKSLDEKE